ncbi:MAG: hypothetical protein JXL20_11950 [Deltaproteobacteria bacterium]|nr:hypothetical protein [Deltaproteobacteria bacterium]
MYVKVIIILAAAVVLLLIFWSLSQGRYGKLRPSREATAAFENYRVDPEKVYYTSGADACPNAIIGIDKSRTLESDLWTKRNLTVEEMRYFVGNMRSGAVDQFLQGFDILDNRGAKIGEWFSLPGISITVWIKGVDRVSISTPPLDLYHDRSAR